jgi:hypothetical protein
MLTIFDRRYLRARKFDVNGAIGQFTDTEKWLKEQRVEELYDHFDVEAYEKARLMVSLISSDMRAQSRKQTSIEDIGI